MYKSVATGQVDCREHLIFVYNYSLPFAMPIAVPCVVLAHHPVSAVSGVCGTVCGSGCGNVQMSNSMRVTGIPPTHPIAVHPIPDSAHSLTTIHPNGHTVVEAAASVSVLVTTTSAVCTTMDVCSVRNHVPDIPINVTSANDTTLATTFL